MNRDELAEIIEEMPDNLAINDFILIFGMKVAMAERAQIAAHFDKLHEGVKHRTNYYLHAANYVRSRNDRTAGMD